MGIELKKDENGKVIYRPLTGWVLKHVGGVVVLATLQYAENQEKLETKERDQIQLLIPPHLALDLAEELKKMAQFLLAGTDGSSPLQ